MAVTYLCFYLRLKKTKSGIRHLDENGARHENGGRTLREEVNGRREDISGRGSREDSGGRGYRDDTVRMGGKFLKLASLYTIKKFKELSEID